MQMQLSIRDQALARKHPPGTNRCSLSLIPLMDSLSARRISTLIYDDVAAVDPRTKYVEVKRSIRVRPHSTRVVVIDDDTAALLEDYLNAQAFPNAVPFEDFRPDTGNPFLFPSPRSCYGLSQWTISRIMRRIRRLSGSSSPLRKENDRRRKVAFARVPRS
jgi:hypothetical protein